MKQFPYNFGLSQEDALSEYKVADLEAKRVLCVASGGEVPLNLLALGAKEVVAYDNNEGQIALCHLKHIAAQQLEPWEAAKFIGYCKQTGSSRIETYKKLRPMLPLHLQTWWDGQIGIIAKGALWQGKFERFLKWLSIVARLIIGKKKFEGIFTLETVQERESYFETAINTRRLRRIFQFFFNEKRYGNNALPAVALRHNNLSLDKAFLECFRTMCTATPPKKNYYMQLLLLREIKFEEALPEYLQPQQRAQFQKNGANIEFRLGDFTNLNPSEKSFDAIILSNICDWMERSSYEKVLSQMAKIVSPQGYLFWRSIYSKFSADECPIHHFEPSTRSLMSPFEEKDRFPFYGFYYLRNTL